MLAQPVRSGDVPASHVDLGIAGVIKVDRVNIRAAILGRQVQRTSAVLAVKLVQPVLPSAFPVGNAASRGLLRSLGFREVGIYERHGQLDGAWRDVVIVERHLLA